MAIRKRKQTQAAPADSLRSDPQTSLSTAAFEAVDDNVISTAGAAVAKGADILSDGGSALGGLARAGMRATGAMNLDAVVDAARGAASAAGGVAGPAAGVALNAAGDVLSSAGELAGPALEATGDIAGAVLGAAADAAGDLLSS